MRSSIPASAESDKLKLDWTQWLCPGPKRVFTAEEMARAGQQPWPKSIDYYVYSNVVVVLAINYNVLALGLLHWAAFYGLGLSYLALWVAKALWQQPTRKRLNFSTLGCVVTLLGVILLLKFQYRQVDLDLARTDQKALMLLVAAVGMLATISWFFLVLIRSQQIAGRLRELDEQALHLKLARRLATAQIQPHFLFNTLASVQHWVDTQDPRAGSTLRSFTAYLRATLPMFERESLSLQEELQIVRSYLEVMQARLGTRLQWSVDVGAEVDEQLLLPPGLLLTLVENAIGHGIEPSLRGGSIAVVVTKRSGEGQVLIEVRDDGAGLAAGAQEGVGLTNSRERLRQQYGERARLSIEPLAPGCLSRLEIQTLEAKP
ncbi:sensor histidine kinase [Roseateles oligotrophus]|uniref:Histidine kinase n=1 Tax=Roseateles oligotrophus TaxID=1769250 RepID=A0ABT2YK20_9BURK|nr:histidine kinase [Roseateles oligotrophus]MCV2370270.1 histidine kinase [Roseateles oligotrophus]